jgi:hypothetical protein
MWLIGYKEFPIAFEFKYDREIPSGASLNKTQRAVKIFKDFYKLSRIGVLSYFVYVTDRIMADTRGIITPNFSAIYSK